MRPISRSMRRTSVATCVLPRALANNDGVLSGDATRRNRRAEAGVVHSVRHQVALPEGRNLRTAYVPRCP
ncbi:hypothetical protein AURDEDRAFT_117888 [Auricularia subglabra TFB-10046 SS5]|uniref:Uncharacterized protein n=1 Tax=Auricularia subglabra (strain TFB-10046 / SS5) TaxID=717982 RepID=J0CSX6_AURST|nr:hypothetical protein AURDEDRAFT_117888 [Auricularia subglabra TFB-10046 SS5]